MVKLTEKKIEVVQVELTKDEAAMLRNILDRSYMAPYLTKSESEFKTNMVEELKDILTPKITSSKINAGVIDWAKWVSSNPIEFR